MTIVISDIRWRLGARLDIFRQNDLANKIEILLKNEGLQGMGLIAKIKVK